MAARRLAFVAFLLVAPVSAADAVRVVTSLTGAMMAGGGGADLCVASVASRTAHALDVYYEGESKPDLKACKHRAKDCKALPLFEALPWLAAFTGESGVIGGGVFASAARNAVRMGNNHSLALTAKARFIFRKVAVIRHALLPEARRGPEETVVVWLDADVFVHRSLADEAFLRFALEHDVSTIYRGRNLPQRSQCCANESSFQAATLLQRNYPETGIVAFNSRSRAAADFVDAWAALFATHYGGQLSCLNDICTYLELFSLIRPQTATHVLYADAEDYAGPPIDGKRGWKLDEQAARALLPQGLRNAPALKGGASAALEAWFWSYILGDDAAGVIKRSRFLAPGLGDWLGAYSPAGAVAWRPETTLAALREGHFATCEVLFATDSVAELVMAREYDWDGRGAPSRLLCPGETEHASPFHLFNYLSHLKGGKSDGKSSARADARIFEARFDVATRFAADGKLVLTAFEGRSGETEPLDAPPADGAKANKSKAPKARRLKAARVARAAARRLKAKRKAKANKLEAVKSLAADAPWRGFAQPRGDLRMGVNYVSDAERLRNSTARRGDGLPACGVDPDARQLRKIFLQRLKYCGTASSRPDRAASTAAAPQHVAMKGTIGVGGELSALLKPFTRAFNAGHLLGDARIDRRGCDHAKPASRCLSLAPWGEAKDFRPSDSAAQRPFASDLSKLWSTAADSRRGVPAAYQHRGLFWWTSQVVGWLLRPDRAAPAQRRREALKKQWKWADRRVLGLHVRRGDTCLGGEGEVERGKGRRCEALDAYAPAARRLISRYGLDTVYLATDDAATLRDARDRADELFGLLPAAVLALPLDRVVYAGAYYNAQLKDKTSKLDPHADALGTLDDIFFLADAHAFVGKFTSNVARLAFALSNARKGGDCVVPYESLDATWCADFGFDSGKSFHGDFVC
ncbi:hypothetical protein M885DRAFT_615150 [Pelagophyceae sp. CCMP2097]|nr:hypothetical protein M885DRAFT_615150 [Pelagophyceae sp. CCMP2097]